MDERGELRPHVNVFVDAESVRLLGGLGAPLDEGSTIVIAPAVSGG
jgi:molybdopterin converting factor small subunit